MWSRDGCADPLVREGSGPIEAFLHDRAQLLEAAGGEEALVIVVDHVGDVEVGRLINPHHGSFGDGGPVASGACRSCPLLSRQPGHADVHDEQASRVGMLEELLED